MSMSSEDEALDLARAEAAVASLLHGTDFNARVKALHESVASYTATPPASLALQEAIDSVYEAFSSRKISQPFDACPCCLGNDDILRLTQTHLRDLTSDDLWAVASNVPWTAGTSDDIAYFLPRMAEELCFSGTLDAESIFERLARVSLSDGERASIQALFDVLASVVTIDSFDIRRTDTLVFCTAVMDMGWEALLDRWRDNPIILDYVSNDVVAGDAYALRGVYWAKRSLLRDIDAPDEITPERPFDLASAHDRILAWLRRPENAVAVHSVHAAHPYGDERDSALAAQIRTLLDNPYRA